MEQPGLYREQLGQLSRCAGVLCRSPARSNLVIPRIQRHGRQSPRIGLYVDDPGSDADRLDLAVGSST